MILIFTENQNGQLKRSSIELLSFAAKSGQPTLAVALGSSAAQAAADCAKYGVAQAHTFSDSSFDRYNPELFTAALADLCKEVKPTTILASASAIGRDLFPRLAARLGAGIASDCTSLEVSGSDVSATKPMYAGKCFAQAKFQGNLKIILMRPNQLPIGEAGTGSAQITNHAAPSVNLKTVIQDVVKGTSEKLDLAEANIIVSGGRGLKEASNFKLLEELAQVLGATVGASRAVVDAGWVSHSMQVGQTGKTVAPNLYIAVGISGAIQHLAGMSGSRVVVAINNDPNAPIFQKATYGIVGDLFQVVPLLTAEFKKALH